MLSQRSLAVAVVLALLCPAHVSAQARLSPAWDSVGAILGTRPTPAAGYVRFNLPRRDITLRVGDVTVAPALGLGAWAGFAGTPDDATMMGDLLVTAPELGPVLAELARQRIDVHAIHNHLAGELPAIIAVHFHAMGQAAEMAARLDRALALTGTPRPVSASPSQPLTIDTPLVFGTLGAVGRASGNVAQVSLILVPGEVLMGGRAVVPALGYGSPINVQMVDARRAVATGDLAVPGSRVDPVLDAMAAHGVVATAVHTHLIGESPKIYFIHFWADGPLTEVATGLRAALDAAR